MTLKNRSVFQDHPFHLVSPSPWPLNCSLSLLALTTSSVSYFHSFEYSGYILLFAFISLVNSMVL